jgi:hypothetical protein
MQTLTEDCRRHWGKRMEGITLVCIPSPILDRLNRDLMAQMSCNPAIGGIPWGGTRTEPALGRAEGSARATLSTQECSLQAGIKESS